MMIDKIEQHETLAEALLNAQSEYPPLEKNHTVNTGTYSYKYADLADTKKATDPSLWKHGLVVNGKTEYREGKEFQVDTLRHVHSKETDISEIEITESDMKKFGGNSTYAKRYNYCNLTGRVSEDDSENRPLEQRRQQPPRKSQLEALEDSEATLDKGIQAGEDKLSGMGYDINDLRQESLNTVGLHDLSMADKQKYLANLRALYKTASKGTGNADQS